MATDYLRRIRDPENPRMIRCHEVDGHWLEIELPKNRGYLPQHVTIDGVRYERAKV